MNQETKTEGERMWMFVKSSRGTKKEKIETEPKPKPRPHEGDKNHSFVHHQKGRRGQRQRARVLEIPEWDRLSLHRPISSMVSLQSFRILLQTSNLTMIILLRPRPTTAEFNRRRPLVWIPPCSNKRRGGGVVICSDDG